VNLNLAFFGQKIRGGVLSAQGAIVMLLRRSIMPRLEFTKPVQLEITMRATNERGVICCEGCGLPLGKKTYEIDHTLADGLQDPRHKKRKLTADDGKLLGKVCCHDPKTKIDVAMIAKAKRVANRDAGVTRPKGRLQGQGFQTAPKRPAIDKTGQRPLPPRAMYREMI